MAKNGKRLTVDDILRAALRVKPTKDMPTTKKTGVSAQTNKSQSRKKAAKKKHK